SRYRRMFVAKLVDAGPSSNFDWAVQTSMPGYERATALATNGNSVYVGGHFFGTVGFGTTSLTSQGDIDAFVAKLDPAGSFVWAQRGGSAAADSVKGLAVNGTGVYVTGGFA